MTPTTDWEDEWKDIREIIMMHDADRKILAHDLKNWIKEKLIKARESALEEAAQVADEDKDYNQSCLLHSVGDMDEECTCNNARQSANHRAERIARAIRNLKSL